MAFRFSMRELFVAVTAVATLLGSWKLFDAFGLVVAVIILGASIFVIGVRRRRSWVTAVGGLLLLPSLGLGLLMLKFGPHPVYRDSQLPFGYNALAEAAGIDTSDAKVFCIQDLIDSEHIWRWCATRSQVELIVKHLGLKPVRSRDVSTSFHGRFPLWYRPPAKRGDCYQSDKFPIYGRGNDGEHYLICFDPESQFLYVWYKFNF